MRPPEVWGGIECTVCRIGDRWRSQLAESGHEHRLSDLDLIAGCGIRTLRYPVLWERCAPRSPDDIDWSWADERLARLRQLGIRPIVGLLHHGSGPVYTHLRDANFPAGLAAFAARVAQRFPWVEDYTPVNEPLTTARFSGLYGVWYPHEREDRSFLRMLVNECAATRLAMQAIRRVNPRARLIQTEDLGTTYATEKLRYQAEFENERRWLSWDLLCGRVDRHHPLRDYLLSKDIPAAELDEFVREPCAPSVIGVNHYITSDRYLDENLAPYPRATWGGNHAHRYADVEAVRVLRGRYRGWRVLLEAWRRYRLPLALTEVHIGSTREEQLRWLVEAWRAAQNARDSGCDIEALTVWALLGSYDWDSLLTRSAGHYESGAFDCRAAPPRATALARITRSLCNEGAAAHPVLAGTPWWHTPAKHTFGPRVDPGVAWIPSAGAPAASRRRPLLICGAGNLGRAFAEACRARGLDYELRARAELDICNAAACEAMLDALQPWAVINATGYVRIDEAQVERRACYRENVRGSHTLCRASARRQLPLLTFSSDQVFDGSGTQPYGERSAVAPLNVYGRSKAAAERRALSCHPRALCVRTAAFFGYWGESDFLVRALRALRAGRAFPVANDVVVSPTYVPDLVQVCLDLLVDEESGLWHLTNSGSISWAEFAARAAQLCDVSAAALRPLPLARLALAAPRPRFSALRSERGELLPSLESALERFAQAARSTHAARWQGPLRTTYETRERPRRQESG